MSDRNVLCFESHPESMMGLQAMLEGLGYEVVVASNAKQAIDVLKERPVEGILLEYDLPDWICCQIRAEVQRIQPDAPVMLFAGIKNPSAVSLFEPYLRNPRRRDIASGDFWS